MSAILQSRVSRSVTMNIDGAQIHATLSVPADAVGLVIFSHTSGASRESPRNHALADVLNDAQLATLICDLLTDEEEVLNEITGEFRFDVKLSARRLMTVIDWCATQAELAGLPIGLFGAGTGAAAAVIASIARRDEVRALVLRGGRLDLAWSFLPLIEAPTLLAAGSQDAPVLAGYQVAMRRMLGDKELLTVPRAGHLFLEPGALEQLSEHAARWFGQHLVAPERVPAGWAAELC